MYLATANNTFAHKGFAFVSYRRHADAEAALARLNGQGYDNLILRAEWASRSESHAAVARSRSEWHAAVARSRGQWPDHRDMHNLEDQVLETLEGPSGAREHRRMREHRRTREHRRKRTKSGRGGSGPPNITVFEKAPTWSIRLCQHLTRHNVRSRIMLASCKRCSKSLPHI